MTIFGRVGGAEEDILIESLRSGGGGGGGGGAGACRHSQGRPRMNITSCFIVQFAEVMNEVRSRVISHKLPCNQTSFLQPVDHEEERSIVFTC